MLPWNMNKNCKISNIKIEILLKKTKNYWYHLQFINSWQYTYIRWFRIFQTSRYQGIVKVTHSGVFEDLKFKISEGSNQNWGCPESALLAVSAKLAPKTVAFKIPWYLEVWKILYTLKNVLTLTVLLFAQVTMKRNS